MSSSPILVAKDIKKNYGSLEVLKGIDLSIRKGEIVSVIGKSGAGKSTLLHILGSLDKPDSGKLTIADQDINEMDDKRLSKFRNLSIGFIFQFHHLLPEFTALENVLIPTMINGLKPEANKLKAIELLNYLGLEERLDHRPNQLSGGEQQRVAVARALINEPAVIFADEPTGNLDDDTSEEIHQLIFQLRKDFNQTFVVVTHDLNLSKLCDRQLTIDDGRIVI